MPTLNLPQDHPLRDRNWRPPNPTWAAEETIARVRMALKRMDPKLDVWWYKWHRHDDPKRPGRWAIMYWLAGKPGVPPSWSVVFFWEGVGGAFRPLTGEAIMPIKNYLAEIEDRDGAALRQKAAACEEANKKRRAKEHEEVVAANVEFADDFLQRDQGIRSIYAPGYIRKRYNDAGDTDRKRYLRSKGLPANEPH